MAGAKNHDYHILPPDAVPIMSAFAALLMAVGALMWMHGGHVGKPNGGGWLFIAGTVAVLACMYTWWAKVVGEAHAGDHTPVVQLHLRYGMILFIASEVMFFVGWFWAFFDFSLFPTAMSLVDGQVERATEGAAALAAQWPPKGLEVINAFELPLLNTLILLLSGTTVTWAHHAMIHDQRGGEKRGLWGLIGVGDRDGVLKGLWVTVVLGAIFTAIQAYEYAHAPFPFKGINYGAAFFMATGFHGFHVLIGTIFLIVCLVRAYKGHFTPKQHFGFEAAAWYWHFVDVVWLFLFVTVYVWGGWGAPDPRGMTGEPPPVQAARGFDEPPLLRAATQGLCPRCGARTLFAGWARFAATCSACGLAFSAFNVGDGPAAFLTLILGTIVVALAIALELSVGPPLWVHLLIWTPVTALGVLASLRLAKAALLAVEYRQRAAEGRLK